MVIQGEPAERISVTETGADGAFQIGLQPGVYELRGENLASGPVPTAMPVPVTVRAGEFTVVTVVFDSGIRGPGPVSGETR